MTYSRFRSALLGVAALCAGLSCGEGITSPDTRDASDTRFLHVQHGFPPLVTTQVSFWAIKGKSTSVDLWFHASPGSRDSVKLLEYRMGPASLDRRPDGTAIAVGDSVLITLTVSDPYHLVVEYQPSGLKFASTDQPLLRLFWTACGDDLNYDGVADARDSALVDQIGIWRQEGPGLPWTKLQSTSTPAAQAIEAPLTGFSGYALMT